MCMQPEMRSVSSRLNSIANNEMRVFETKGVQPYSAPFCRIVDLRVDRNFLESGDFGQGGYPGDDLEPGDEYDF